MILTRLFIALIAIPLGLDLYLPVPQENPITQDKVALGRQLFFDRRLRKLAYVVGTGYRYETWALQNFLPAK